jgi:signal transduction histidine kinase
LTDDNITKLHISIAEVHGIKIESETLGRFDPAAIDYKMMHECLTNLVGNAIDASRSKEDSGTGKFVKLRTVEENGVIHYEVIDNGCGMDAETKDKVFISFLQPKGSRAPALGC